MAEALGQQAALLAGAAVAAARKARGFGALQDEDVLLLDSMGISGS